MFKGDSLGHENSGPIDLKSPKFTQGRRDTSNFFFECLFSPLPDVHLTKLPFEDGESAKVNPLYGRIQSCLKYSCMWETEESGSTWRIQRERLFI